MKIKSYKYVFKCPGCHTEWIFVDYRGIAEFVIREYVDARCLECKPAYKDWRGYVRGPAALQAEQIARIQQESTT